MQLLFLHKLFNFVLFVSSAHNGVLTYLVPKPKEAKKKPEAEETKEDTTGGKPPEEGEEESLYDRFGRLLKRN